MAPASAQLMTDIILNRNAFIDIEPYKIKLAAA